MCFSATASITVGATLIGVGGLTIRSARSSRELPLAGVPLLFGLQQLSEGAIWMSLGDPGSSIQHWSVRLYLLFALMVWPTLIPFATWLIEPDVLRRRAIAGLGMLGFAVSAFLAIAIVGKDVTATAELRRIVYDLPAFPGDFNALPYIAAVCVPLLLSSLRSLNVLGIFAIATSYVAHLLYVEAFLSVWCFMAASISLVLTAHFMRPSGLGAHRPGRPSCH